MEDRTWSGALIEIADDIVGAVLRFWKQDFVQVVLAVGMFFWLAVPLLLVILVLWLIDASGWRPDGGFYKIGASVECPAGDRLTPVPLLAHAARPAREPDRHA